MELLFKQAPDTEIDLALTLLKEAAENIRAKGLTQWNIWLSPKAEQIKWVRDGFANGEFQIVCTEEGKIAGMFRLSAKDILYWGEQTEEAAYIHSLIVAKEFSGQDLGKKIILQVQDNLLKNGINLLRLDCNAENKWLCSYYEHQGFIKVGQKQMPHALNNLYEKKL